MQQRGPYLTRRMEWIDRRGGTTTVRDLTRGPREFRGDPERAAKALGELLRTGVGKAMHTPAGVRRTASGFCRGVVTLATAT